jgi:small subunit ribosomal protein S9
VSKTQILDKDGKVLHFLGLGRRKAAVARVRLRPNGSGNVVINKRPLEEYCVREQDRNLAVSPLNLIGVRRTFDVHVTVSGGGIAGQAGAVRHGLARALVNADAKNYQPLKDAGLLTRDSRKVERKKPGKAGARASFQFSKR